MGLYKVMEIIIFGLIIDVSDIRTDQISKLWPTEISQPAAPSAGRQRSPSAGRKRSPSPGWQRSPSAGREQRNRRAHPSAGQPGDAPWQGSQAWQFSASHKRERYQQGLDVEPPYGEGHPTSHLYPGHNKTYPVGQHPALEASSTERHTLSRVG